MARDKLIKKIEQAAKRDAKKRQDPRYKRVMAFFVKKGFLRTNNPFAEYYVSRLRIEDAVWVGKNLEPRVLEVLPAAVARFPKAFLGNLKATHISYVLKDLRDNNLEGRDFMNIPYKKIKVWMDLPLFDKRTKPASTKKITKTMRLSPVAIEKMTEKRKEAGLSEAEFVEQLIADFK